MTGRIPRATIWTAATLLAFALVLTACGSPAPPRRTDARAILSDAIAATAALPTARIHVEITAPVEGPVNGVAALPTFQFALDADVELATRSLAGRATARLPQAPDRAQGEPQTADLIVANGATFAREPPKARWSKGLVPGPGGGPTNADYAAILTALLATDRVTLELAEPTPCTLGTCDRVIAHVAGESLWVVLAPFLGMRSELPAEADQRIDLDILVDQETSIVSEVRAETVTAASTTRLLLTIINPGDPVQIGPPPAALIDDVGANEGGGAGAAPVPAETSPPSVAESPITP